MLDRITIYENENAYSYIMRTCEKYNVTEKQAIEIIFKTLDLLDPQDLDGYYSEKSLDIKVRNINKPCSFYTGGGIWLCCMHADINGHYYTIDNFYDSMGYFSDGYSKTGYGFKKKIISDLEEFPLYEMVWSKNIKDLDTNEKKIFDLMCYDLKKHDI